MKLTVDATELKRALDRVRKVIGPKPPQLPIMSYAKLEVHGGKATLTGTNGAQTLTLPIHPQECSDGGALSIYPEEDGCTFLPVKQILGILGGCEKSVIIETSDTKLTLRGGPRHISEFEFFAIEPAPSESKASFKLKDFKKLLSRVEFAIPAKSGRLLTAACLVESTAERLRVAATDGTRIAVAELAGSFTPLHFLVQRDAISILKGLKGKVIQYAEGQKSHFFTASGVVLGIRKTSAQFPVQYEKVLANAKNGVKASIEVPVVEFQGAVASIIPVTNKQEPKARFSIEGNELTVSTIETETEFGEGSDSISGTRASGSEKVILNPVFVLDFLKHAEGNVTVGISAGGTVSFFDNAGVYMYVLAPKKGA